LKQDLIRISVGTEHIDDIIADFEQSFANAATDPSKPEGEDPVDNIKPSGPAKMEA